MANKIKQLMDWHEVLCSIAHQQPAKSAVAAKSNKNPLKPNKIAGII